MTDCTGAVGGEFAVRGTESVTVPAGTFEALVLVGEPRIYGDPRDAGDRTVEYWAGTEGLVRADLLNGDGVLRGSLVRASESRGSRVWLHRGARERSAESAPRDGRGTGIGGG